MLHRDVYKIVQTDTDKELGNIAICLDPGSQQSFSYYFRNAEGAYTLLCHLHGMDVDDLKELEHEKLWRLLDTCLGGDADGTWSFQRLSGIKWRDTFALTPPVSLQAWLLSELAYFQEDEQ